MIKLLLPSLAIAFNAAPQAARTDPLAELAAQIEASESTTERVQLARLGRRLDTGGSVWWFEVEARERLQQRESAAVIRLCSEALDLPLQDPDRARMFELRASAYSQTEDRTRAIGDLWQVVQLAPDNEMAQARLHELLAARLQARQERQVLRNAANRTVRLPDEARSWIRLAEVQLAQDGNSAAVRSYETAVRLNTEALTAGDWATYGQLCLSRDDPDTAFDAFSSAVELDPTRDYSEQLDTALSMQRAWLGADIGDVGYGGYDEEPDLTGTVPIAELGPKLETWTAALSVLKKRYELSEEAFSKLSSAIYKFTEGLEGQADLSKFQETGDRLQDEFTAWLAEFEALALEIDALFAVLKGQRNRCRADSPTEEKSELCERLMQLLEDNYDLEGLTAIDLRVDITDSFNKRSAAIIAEQIAQEAETLRARESIELLSQRAELSAAEVVARAGQLLATGTASPELLAAFGIACVDSGDAHKALVPLHLSLATPEQHELHEEVLARLANLQANALEELAIARSLFDSDDFQAALTFAERAADLDPTNADCHVVEAACQHALDEVEDEQSAIRFANLVAPWLPEAADERDSGSGWPAARKHLPIRVPLDRPDLQSALNLATPGQTIILDAGEWVLMRPIDMSIRIVGAGADQTVLRFDAKDVETRPDSNWSLINPTKNNAWVEATDLSFGCRRSAGSTPPKGELKLRFEVGCGSLSLTRCGTVELGGFQIEPGARLSAFDCDFSGGKRDTIHARGASLVLERVQLTQAVKLTGGATLHADNLALQDEGTLHLTGLETRARIDSLSAHTLRGSAIFATEGGYCEIENALFIGDNEPAFAEATAPGAIQIAKLLTIGSSQVAKGSVQIAEQTTVELPNSARPETPRRVTNEAEFTEALAAGAHNLVIAPGVYLLGSHIVREELVLRAEAPGVRLLVLSNREPYLFRIEQGAKLELEGIELGLSAYRRPIKGERIFGSAGFYKIEVRHNSYSLLDVRGDVLLKNCKQERIGLSNETNAISIATVSSGSLTSLGLQDAHQLNVIEQGEAWLVDGAASRVEVSGGGSALFGGRYTLDRLEVTGPNARIELRDCRPARLGSVAFREGAYDPRSDLQKSQDGIDPEVLQAKEIAAAHEEWLQPLLDGRSSLTWEAGLVRYAVAYETALINTMQDSRERAALAAEAIIPYLLGRKDRIRMVLHTIPRYYSYPPLYYAVRDQLPDDDIRWYRAESRAISATGSYERTEEFNIIASWEEAIMANSATRDEYDEAKSYGLSFTDYRAEQARIERLKAERERKAEVAIASGNPDRIREALTAISLNRWLTHVRYDEHASLASVRDALAAAAGTTHEYSLENKYRKLAPRSTVRYATGSTSYNSTPTPYHQNNSTSDFQQWQTQARTWNRDMGLKLKAIKNSSYNSFRNTYKY